MIAIEIKNQHHQTISGKIDHEKEVAPFRATNQTQAVLAIKEYAYQTGDYIEVTLDTTANYLMVQLEETLAPSLIYVPEHRWVYQILTTPLEKKAMVDTAFISSRHHLMVRYAYPFEIKNYQNLTFNAYDQKEFTGAYPHAYANVETRDETVFFAKNAIDGRYGNLSHGSYPFASWGINQMSEAALTIDFGRLVVLDWVQLFFRSDYPHDSYWDEVTVAFSDGTQQVIQTTNSLDSQSYRMNEQRTTYLRFYQLKKHPDVSPFPALTQIEAFGKNCLSSQE